MKSRGIDNFFITLRPEKIEMRQKFVIRNHKRRRKYRIPSTQSTNLCELTLDTLEKNVNPIENVKYKYK